VFASDGQRSYLVECYWPGVNEEKLTAAVARVVETVGELREEGRDLRFLQSIFVPADETVFWLFGGSEADVRAASQQAGVQFERVLESRWIDGTNRRSKR
jgi:hypothetical protein